MNPHQSAALTIAAVIASSMTAYALSDQGVPCIVVTTAALSFVFGFLAFISIEVGAKK